MMMESWVPMACAKALTLSDLCQERKHCAAKKEQVNKARHIRSAGADPLLGVDAEASNAILKVVKESLQQ